MKQEGTSGMPQYYVPDLNLDPNEFAASINAGDHYTIPDIGGDGHDIDEELNELENRPDVSSTAWTEFISQIKKPDPLKLQGHYLLERQDKKHRMGDLLEVCLDAYKTHDPGDKDCKHFYKWLDSMSDWDRLMLVKGKVRFQLSNAHRSQGASSEDSNIQPSMVKAFMKGVAYLDQAGRRSHRLRFVAGAAMLNGVEFDTREMQTVHSGRGFAIWVMSETGWMYAGNHVKGMLHHSSFLAGANIMCGGELKASMGKISYLSSKTGHYQAGTEHMVWALSALEPRVDNFDEIKVLAFKNKVPVMLSPTILRFSPGSYDSWGVLKESQKESIRKGDFTGFPNH
jgi:hypothetical protein